MAFSRNSVFPSVGRGRSPQTDHPLLLRRGPEKDDVTGRITISERQSDNFCVEVFRDFSIRDCKVGFVQMHLPNSEKAFRAHHWDAQEIPILLLDQ